MQTNHVTTQSYKVTDLQLLDAQIYRVILQCSQGVVPDYKAGQYLEILLPDGVACAFSIASPPTARQKSIELHIQKIPDRKNSIKLFEELEKGWVSIRMAKGLCHLGTVPNKPLVFVAAGTGFAQMKAMIEHCFHLNHPHAMHLYWGARSPEGFYLPSLPVHWSSSQFHYHPVVSEVSEEGDWEGRQGLLFEAILADRKKLTGSEVYISGSPQMAYATVDALVRENFKDENIHSDVFEYAPRH